MSTVWETFELVARQLGRLKVAERVLTETTSVLSREQLRRSLARLHAINALLTDMVNDVH